MSSYVYSGIAAALVVISAFAWLRWAQSLNLSREKRRSFIAVLFVALALGLAGTITATGWLEYVASAPSILLSGLLLYFHYHSRQSGQTPAVKVGDIIIDFSAPDENGEGFGLSSLAGSAYILKFYRGHWCPYCMGELSEWGKMLPELRKLGVEHLVYVSTDSPENIRKGKPKHNSRGIQLSDPRLEIAKLYQVDNRGKNVTPPGVKVPGLPIPTTILVDADGIARWVDQTGDYQVRSNAERVLAAIRSAGLTVKSSTSSENVA